MLGLMCSQWVAYHHHLQQEQTLESTLQPRGLIWSCWHEVVPAPLFLWSQVLANTKGRPCLCSCVQVLLLEPSTFGAKGANGAWDYHALSKEYCKISDITPSGTRETEISCPVCLPADAALVDRQAWVLLFFQHRHSCPARIWHLTWKGKLLVLSWKSITAGSNPDKLEKACQEAMSTFKAKFLQVCRQLQLRLSCHTI